MCMTAPLRRAALFAAAALLAAPWQRSPRRPSCRWRCPGDAAAASLPAARATWIVGARPSAASRVLARRFGARRAGPAGTGGYVVARGRARALAAALRRSGLLVYAQPNTLAHLLQGVPNDPLSVAPDDWRAKVADPALVPPTVTPASPLIASSTTSSRRRIPSSPAATRRRCRSSRSTTPTAPRPPRWRRRRSTASGSSASGRARALNVPLPPQITCVASANAIGMAIEQGAAVINMSYGSSQLCVPEYVALQFAVARGIVPVAAAGNEFAVGNPPEFPASLPHVLTIAALGPGNTSSLFSNANGAVDLSAPGEDIMTAVPPALDGDPVKDGYERQNGTSFSAPMVAAAVAWIRAKRPTLTADQAAQAVRLSATDLAPAGWDANTGFGILSVGAAERITPPPPDPAEPNDDIRWVDGQMFSKPDRLFYTGRGRRSLRALLDVFEDPADVSRVRLRPPRA